MGVKDKPSSSGEVLHPTPKADTEGRVFSEVDIEIGPLGYKRIELTSTLEETRFELGWLVITAKEASQFEDVNIRTSFFYEFRNQQTGEVFESIAVLDQTVDVDSSKWRAMPVEMTEWRDTGFAVTPDWLLDFYSYGPFDTRETLVHFLLLDVEGRLVATANEEFLPCNGLFASELFP